MEEPMKIPVVLLASLLVDIGRLQPDVKGLDRDIATIKLRYKHEGYGFLTIALPAFGDALVRGLSVGKFTSPLGFKNLKGAALPRLFSGLLSDVFEPSSGLIKESPVLESVISLRQIFALFKKVELASDEADILHQKAIAGFFQNDGLTATSVMTERDRHLMGVVCTYILPHLADDIASLDETPSYLGLTEVECKHGPGAVVEGYRPNQKWSGVWNGILTDAFDTHRYGYGDFGIVDRIDLSSTDQPSLPGLTDVRPKTADASRSIAKLTSVAKNSTSRRTITIEPLVNQFIQQGLNAVLRQSIDKCDILNQSLALTDQSQNQKLALEGSIHANWSTLDLKSASDLLSLTLVSDVFGPRHSKFLSAMLECRTPMVSCGGSPRIIGKFAGMGNALTFPVQSIVFAVIAITAIVDKLARKPTHEDVRRAARCVRVYGDDIIVRTEHVHQVVAWLQGAGLIVNTQKSFLDGYFKESCGVDAYRGVDVTPLYCRFRPDDDSIEPRALAQAVAFSNHAWLKGYYSLSNLVKEDVEQRLGRRLPLVSSSSAALGWHSRTEAMEAHSWDQRLQRLVTKSLTLIPRKRKDVVDGWAALLKYFHVPLLGRPLKHLSESSMRFKLKIAQSRVPTEVG
jgi:hypothetical protein